MKLVAGLVIKWSKHLPMDPTLAPKGPVSINWYEYMYVCAKKIN